MSVTKLPERPGGRNQVAVYLQRVVAHPEDSPRTANTFFLNHVDSEILLELAHYDVGDFQARVSGQVPNEKPLPAFVTARYVLTHEQAQTLHDHLAAMLQQIGKP